MIYFDHNATTPLDERVLEAMHPFLTTFYANPSSLHQPGRIVRSAIDSAREQVANLIGAQANQIIFTSGGTEANNLVFNTVKSQAKIAVSAIEHPSIIDPFLQSQQNKPDFIPVNQQGLLLKSSIEALIHKKDMPALVSIMLANNENGVIQDIKQFVQLLRDQPVLIHTDAIQAAGKLPLSFSQLGVDLMSLSSHKIYGPKGCGALVIKKRIDIRPLLNGGGQENGLRAGTENVAAIVGFGKAAELATLELEQRTQQLLSLRIKLEQALKTIPELVIFAESENRLANTTQFGIKGVDGEMLLMYLDQNKIAVSSGSACKSGGGKASSVLTAMGIDFQLAKSAIRISLGKANTEAEVTKFITLLKSFLSISG